VRRAGLLWATFTKYPDHTPLVTLSGITYTLHGMSKCMNEFKRRAAKMHGSQHTHANICVISRLIPVFRDAYKGCSLDVVWMMVHTVGYVDGTNESGT